MDLQLFIVLERLRNLLDIVIAFECQHTTFFNTENLFERVGKAAYKVEI